MIVQVTNFFSGIVDMETRHGNFYQRCKEIFVVTMKNFSVKNDIIQMIFKQELVYLNYQNLSLMNMQIGLR